MFNGEMKMGGRVDKCENEISVLNNVSWENWGTLSKLDLNLER